MSKPWCACLITDTLRPRAVRRGISCSIRGGLARAGKTGDAEDLGCECVHAGILPAARGNVAVPTEAHAANAGLDIPNLGGGRRNHSQYLWELPTQSCLSDLRKGDLTVKTNLPCLRYFPSIKSHNSVLVMCLTPA